MLRNYVIHEAVDKVIRFYEMEGIICDTNAIVDKTAAVYDHHDYTDPEIVAALVLDLEYPNTIVTYDEARKIRDFYFRDYDEILPCHNPNSYDYSDIPIWDIEDAQRDLMWM